MKKLNILIPVVIFISFSFSSCALFEPLDLVNGSTPVNNNNNLSILTTNTVTFDSQGANIPANPGVIYVISPATIVGTLPIDPVKTNYNFAGWYTATNGGGSQFTANTPVLSNITVYAYWSAYPVYTVTYIGNGGLPATNSQLVISNSNVGTLPEAPTNSGFVFSGWWTTTNGSGLQFYSCNSCNLQYYCLRFLDDSNLYYHI